MATSRPVIRAVCDTNVLVPPTRRKALHEAARMGLFQPIWSPWIIGELYRVLTWQWAQDYGVTAAERRRCADQANRMMELLLDQWALTDIVRPWPAGWGGLADPWDLPILATAVVVGAPYVVSDNVRDFPPPDPEGRHVWQGVQYVTFPVFMTDVLHQSL